MSEREELLGSRLAAAESELAQRSVALARTERALDAATTEVRAVQGTWSWRVTRPIAPLRGAGRTRRDELRQDQLP